MNPGILLGYDSLGNPIYSYTPEQLKQLQREMDSVLKNTLNQRYSQYNCNRNFYISW